MTKNQQEKDRVFFRNLRLTLTPALAPKAPSAQEQAKQIREFVRRNENYQRRRLKVWVGGFIFVDPVTLKTVQLFRGDSSHEDAIASKPQDAQEPSSGAVSYPLPYSWNTSQSPGYEELVDEMFFSWRAAETLQEVPQSDQGRPEYYQYLNSNRQPAKTAGSDFWPQTGCYYCPWGEALFYMLGWRLLLRLAQTIGWQGLVSQDTTILADEKATSSIVWSDKLWQSGHSREHRWFQRLRTLRSELATAWGGISAKAADSVAGRDAWLTDWETLGLLRRSARGGISMRRAMRPLLSYCICQSRTRTRTMESKQICPPSQFDAETVKRGTLFDKIRFVERTILLAFAKNLKQAKSITVQDCLGVLHQTAMFPILPYFYWNVIDPAPRTHMVVPVHHSAANPVSLAWSLGSPDPGRVNRIAETKEPVTVTLVGVAVVAVRPFESLDWTTLAISQRRACRAADEERCLFVRDYFELLARPLIDQYFMERVRATPSADSRLRPLLVNPDNNARLSRGFRVTKGFMFCDISESSRFIQWMERVDQKSAGPILRDLCTWMAKRIRARGGIVDKFIGDEVMAYFGDALHDTPPSGAELRACCDAMVDAAIDIHQGFHNQVKYQLSRRGITRTPVKLPNMRTVINHESVFWGILGAEGFMSVSILTENVARTVRIMQHARERRRNGKSDKTIIRTIKPGEIWVTKRVWDSLTVGKFVVAETKDVRLRSYTDESETIVHVRVPRATRMDVGPEVEVC